MQIPLSKILLLFGLVTLVTAGHAWMAIREQGPTLDAVAPVAIGYLLCLTIVSTVLYHMSRPIEGVDPSSQDAWALRARPLFKWLRPIGLLANILLIAAWLLGVG